VRRALLLVVCCVLASCDGGVGRVAEREVVPVPHVRGTPAPGDAAERWLLASSKELVAIPDVGSLGIHVEPGTERPFLHLGSSNPWGQRLRLSVLRGATDETGELWVRVRLPIWPNGQRGWVDASDVRLVPTRERLVVDLSERRLTRFHGSRVIDRIPVGVGAAPTPTPPGRYFVWARVATGRPSGPYGSFILGLSGFSDTIEPWSDWPGEPRLAIHGTDDPSDAGRAISNGCIRVPNALLHGLRDVPMGTPVVIRP
jgi:L,D-transpeptidase catalytic domain